jgi:ankyrin repeat protein
LSEAIYTSPLRQADGLNQEEHLRRNKALWKEKEQFMRKLQMERTVRHQSETDAANVLQRIFRGHTLRKNWEQIKRRNQMRKRMRGNMLNVTQGKGLVLADRDRKARVLKHTDYAATCVQRRYRGILGRRSAAKERLMRYEEIRNGAATGIQCMMRKCVAKRAANTYRVRYHQGRRVAAALVVQRQYRCRLGRKVGARKRMLLELMCIVLVQRATRRYFAVKARRKERVRVREETANLATIDIQRIFRGKLSRRRVGHLRNIENEEIEEACCLSIQRVFRGHLGRCVYRGENKRQTEEAQLWGCLSIQCIARGYLGRSLYQEEYDKQRADIYAQARRGDAQQVDDLYAGFGTASIHKPTDVDANGNTVLLVACQYGQRKITRKCLRWGMDINHENDNMETAVQLAVMGGHGRLAEYLITKKAEVNFFGRTLLHEAAHNGLVGVVESLLLRGLDPNELDPDSNMTPLLEGAGNGFADVVQLLIDRGADINAVNNSQQSALHLAATQGYKQIVLKLMEFGADVAALDSKGRTPWRCALVNEYEDIANTLRGKWSEMTGQAEMNAVADSFPIETKLLCIEHARAGEFLEVEAIVDSGLPIDYADPDTGDTILMLAAASGNEQLIDFCLRKGANANLENKAGRIALHFIAPHHNLSSRLLEETKSVAKADDTGRTPLHEAASFGYTYEARFQSDVMDINQLVDHEGRSLLHEAASSGAMLVSGVWHRV